MTYIAALGLQVDRDNVQYIRTAALRSAATVQAAELIHHIHKCPSPLQVVLTRESTKSSVQGVYRVFPGGKERPGRDADPSAPSSAVVMKGYSHTSTTPMSRTACTEPQCLYKGALYLYLLRKVET